VQPRLDPIQPVVVETDPQAELQDGGNWSPTAAPEHCLQLRISMDLPGLQCNPALPGPAEPGPTVWANLPAWPWTR